jgi:peptidoglycan/xylan/chitin deacetylase (PgdA/CDA1 family)
MPIRLDGSLVTMPTRRTFLLGALSVAGVAACGKAARRAAAPATGSGATGGGATAAPATPAATDTTIVPPPGAPAAYIAHGPRTSTVVALTFHGAGDPALTDQMLALAARLQAPITVFAVGQWLQQHPDISGKILAAGHQLANHTYTHPSLSTLGQAAVAQEITKCRDVLVVQSRSTGDYFRPSGVNGQPSQLILEEAGKAGYGISVGFDVDSLDYTDPGASAIVSRVAAGVRPGSIVSLHLGHSGTVAAFERVVGAIRSRGLAPALVRDVLP